MAHFPIFPLPFLPMCTVYGDDKSPPFRLHSALKGNTESLDKSFSAFLCSLSRALPRSYWLSASAVINQTTAVGFSVLYSTGEQSENKYIRNQKKGSFEGPNCDHSAWMRLLPHTLLRLSIITVSHSPIRKLLLSFVWSSSFESVRKSPRIPASELHTFQDNFTGRMPCVSQKRTYGFGNLSPGNRVTTQSFNHKRLLPLDILYGTAKLSLWGSPSP